MIEARGDYFAAFDLWSAAFTWYTYGEKYKHLHADTQGSAAHLLLGAHRISKLSLALYSLNITRLSGEVLSNTLK